MDINDRVYILDTTTTDDCLSVLVIPATIKRIITTEEVDDKGEEVRSTSYMVRYDGESSSRSYHHVDEANVVSVSKYDYNPATKVGAAILAAIAAHAPKPEIIAPPPADPQPSTVMPKSEPF